MGRTAIAEQNVGALAGVRPPARRVTADLTNGAAGTRLCPTQAPVLRVVRHNKRGDQQDDHQADVGRSCSLSASSVV